MQDISNGITKKTEAVVLYILTRDPNEVVTIRDDLDAAITFERALRSYLELRGCKKIYVNMTGYSYILRLSYIPTHCNENSVVEELNDLIYVYNGIGFKTYAEAYSYGKKDSSTKLKEYIASKTGDEVQMLIDRVEKWRENNETD